MNVAGGGSINAMSILLSLVVPGLYIYGAMQVQKGDWQPQQPKTAQAVHQPRQPSSPYSQMCIRDSCCSWPCWRRQRYCPACS